jgi:hypothetical protein
MTVRGRVDEPDRPDLAYEVTDLPHHLMKSIIAALIVTSSRLADNDDGLTPRTAGRAPAARGPDGRGLCAVDHKLNPESRRIVIARDQERKIIERDSEGPAGAGPGSRVALIQSLRNVLEVAVDLRLYSWSEPVTVTVAAPIRDVPIVTAKRGWSRAVHSDERSWDRVALIDFECQSGC